MDGNGERETLRRNLEGGNDEGDMGRGATGTERGWQWGGGQCEEEMERGAMGKGQDGKGVMGIWKGERDGDEEKKEQAEGRFHRWI